MARGYIEEARSYIEDLARAKQEAEQGGNVDIINGRIFWSSDSYEEYRMKCDIEGIEAIFSRSDFESMHQYASKPIEIDVTW